MTSLRCRNYGPCTLFNVDHSFEWVSFLDPLKDKIRYACGQIEKCPDTGKLHLQFFIQFEKVQRGATLMRLWPGVHLEMTKKPEETRDYCMKEISRIKGPWEFGEWLAMRSGKRTDLDEVKAAIDDGATELEIAENYFSAWCANNGAFRRYRTLKDETRSWKTLVIISWGDTGTGKTRAVYEAHNDVYDLPRPNGGSVWWDGYVGQEVVLLDDFYGWIPLHLLLKLGDRYPLQVPVKGGMTNFRPKYLYITSNRPWTEWYKWEELGYRLKDAFERRIDSCVAFRWEGDQVIKTVEQ